MFVALRVVLESHFCTSKFDDECSEEKKKLKLLEIHRYCCGG